MLNPTEVNIRASWAINCAVAMGNIHSQTVGITDDMVIYERAKMFLKLLDEVKAIIEPPLKAEQGMSKAERLDKVGSIDDFGQND